MKKYNLFILAMKAQCYRKVAWVISAFSKVIEAPDAYLKDLYPYRIVATPSGYFFVDPQKDYNLTLIEDGDVSVPLYSPNEQIEITPKDVENVDQAIKTTYGNLFFNYHCLIYAVGKKIPYMQGRVDDARIEKEVLKRFETDQREIPAWDQITTQEYIKLADSVFHLENYMQLFTPAGSEKSMTTHPDMQKLRDQLFEENKDRLHDPAVFADICKKLEALDRQWLADDPDSMNFYLKSKSFNVIRRKLFETIGSDAGLSDGVEISPISKSLEEGWGVQEFPKLNNASRSASFSRGAETMMGGVEVKWLLRAASNLKIITTPADCGSTIGTMHVVKENFLNFTVINDDGSLTLLDQDTLPSYIGKYARLRSTLFCKMSKTDYCSVCAGPRLSLNPTSAFTSISRIGDTMLAISLGAAHSTAIEVEKMDTTTFLS